MRKGKLSARPNQKEENKDSRDGKDFPLTESIADALFSLGSKKRPVVAVASSWGACVHTRFHFIPFLSKGEGWSVFSFFFVSKRK